MFGRDDRKNKYYVNVEPTVNNLILPYITDKSWTLLHGARSSGKSTADVVTET